MLPTVAADFNYREASSLKTIQIYKSIPLLSDTEFNYGQEVIKGLDYNSSRIFRQLCILPGISFSKSKKAWSELLKHQLSYEQVLLFETWSKLIDANIDMALRALPVLKSLSYEAGKSFKQYCLLPDISAQHALHVVPLLTRLDGSGNRATLALFSITDISSSTALDALGLLIRLSPNQSIAVEAFAKTNAMDSLTMLDALVLIRQFHHDNAWNASTLFSAKNIKGPEAWYWLTSYFANPPDVQEQLFYQLTPERKKTLTSAFYRGGTEIIWRINDYHSITDRFGIEISKNELRKNSKKQLVYHFEKLSPKIKIHYEKQFYSLSRKDSNKEMIALLRKATAAARISTAKLLVSANIYALLAQGSELYDSSFRNLLVPILIKRIQETHNGNLLDFINKTDPENLYISDFIVSLAQKGKLTAFFPENSKDQKEILRLVVQSAFRDENSIILFSATFTQLLKLLGTTPRNFLIEQMIIKSKTEHMVFSKLIRVILQYYLVEFPGLLSKNDRHKIISLLQKNTKIDLGIYLKTPLKEWKSDKHLRSLSIFHPDDDGYNSFISFAQILLKDNYKPSFSQRYTVGNLPKATKKNIEGLIVKIRSAPGTNLSKLYSSQQDNHYSVTFSKKINDINISHCVFIYSDEKIQAKLFELFILSGDEMFAQRGHSYWRSQQLIDPLKKLLATKTISKKNLMDKQRFLSLGSCGGVKSYTNLNNLFMGKVDLLATIGTGMAIINDPYNKNLFEIIANNQSSITWKDIGRLSAHIFEKGHGKDYLQPGSLPAILHKIINEDEK